MTIPYDVFAEIDVRVGTIIAAEPYPEARRPAGKFMSEVLVLGFPDAAGAVVPVAPDKPVANGGRLF